MRGHTVVSAYKGGTLSATTTAQSITLTSVQNEFTDCRLGTLYVHVSSISTAASLIWYITRDSSGDEPIVGKTTTTLFTGKTTATDGGIVVNIGTGLPKDLAASTANDLRTLYLWIATDAGTCTVDRVVLSTEVGE